MNTIPPGTTSIARHGVQAYQSAASPEQGLQGARDTVARLGREAETDLQRLYSRSALQAVEKAGLRPETAGKALETVLSVLCCTVPPNCSVAAMLAWTASGARAQVAPEDRLLLGSAFLQTIAEVGGQADALVANRASEQSRAGDGAPALADCFQTAAFDTLMNTGENHLITGLNGVNPVHAEAAYYFRAGQNLDALKERLQQEIDRRP